MLLRAENIEKKYGKETILHGIHLSLERGELVAITGASGNGKTTLLSILGLLQEADAGAIFLDGKEVQSLGNTQKAALRRQYMGFVFQRARLVGALTVQENILLPAWLFGKTAARKKRGEELLKIFGLAAKTDFFPAQLSQGQLRRTVLARALLLEPALLLADEPTNDLDEVSAGTVWRAIQQVRTAGAGVLLVTHDMQYARQADRMLLLEKGALRLADTPLDDKKI